jgi:predicted CXXCH cytochrome family protein
VTTNHPVGVRYGARGSSVALRPASLLPDNVRLPDGTVSCVSCHDLYARDGHLLSVPLDESTLCYTCHDMD